MKKMSVTSVLKSREEYYIEATYKKFVKKYNKVLSEYDLSPEIKLLVYSIMIVENFNRPLGVRIIERVFSIFKKEGTYGIMQVKSIKSLSDVESIYLSVDKITENYEKIYNRTLLKNPEHNPEQMQNAILERTVWFYNRSPNYIESVMTTKYQLESFESKKTPLDKDILDDLRLDAYYNS
ncbi:MAG: hypothetical protein ACK41T_05880 [Pseudobdellovibrio sp.]